MGISADLLADVYAATYPEDIEKTASADEETYLTKTAEVADHIAAGNIETDADLEKVAASYDVAPSDVVAIYNLAYGDTAEEGEEELDKEAALQEVDALLKDETAGYLAKTAAVASLFAQGLLTADEATKTAEASGLDIADINYLLPEEA